MRGRARITRRDQVRDFIGPAERVRGERPDPDAGEEAGQDVPLGRPQLVVALGTDADGGREVPEGRETVGVVGVGQQLSERVALVQVGEARRAALDDEQFPYPGGVGYLARHQPVHGVLGRRDQHLGEGVDPHDGQVEPAQRHRDRPAALGVQAALDLQAAPFGPGEVVGGYGAQRVGADRQRLREPGSVAAAVDDRHVI